MLVHSISLFHLTHSPAAVTDGKYCMPLASTFGHPPSLRCQAMFATMQCFITVLREPNLCALIRQIVNVSVAHPASPAFCVRGSDIFKVSQPMTMRPLRRRIRYSGSEENNEVRDGEPIALTSN